MQGLSNTEKDIGRDSPKRKSRLERTETRMETPIDSGPFSNSIDLGQWVQRL